MGRPHWHPRSCKVCGRSTADGYHVSQTGLCLDDATQRWTENHVQLKAHSGPWFDHWRRRVAAAVGGVLLDSRPRDDDTELP